MICYLRCHAQPNKVSVSVVQGLSFCTVIAHGVHISGLETKDENCCAGCVFTLTELLMNGGVQAAQLDTNLLNVINYPYSSEYSFEHIKQTLQSNDIAN